MNLAAGGQPAGGWRRLRDVLRRLIAAAALAAAALAACSGPAGRSTGVPSSRPLARLLVPLAAIPLGFQPARLVLGGNDVYVIGLPHAGVTELARVNVAAEAVQARVDVAGCVAAASLTGGSLVVLAGRIAANLCLSATSLQVRDPTTLSVRAARAVPPSADVLARPGAIYVSQPAQVAIYSLATLAPLGSIAVPPADQSALRGAALAADPRSDVLWIGIPNGMQPLAIAVSFATHRVLGQTKTFAVEEPVPQGFGDDAWLIYATGMMSAVSLVAPDGRVLVQPISSGPNSAVEQVTGRHLWTAYSLNGATVDCRSLPTGAIEGSATVSANDGAFPPAFGADNSHVYLGLTAGLQVYRPSGPCG